MNPSVANQPFTATIETFLALLQRLESSGKGIGKDEVNVLITVAERIPPDDRFIAGDNLLALLRRIEDAEVAQQYQIEEYLASAKGEGEQIPFLDYIRQTITSAVCRNTMETTTANHSLVGSQEVEEGLPPLVYPKIFLSRLQPHEQLRENFMPSSREKVVKPGEELPLEQLIRQSLSQIDAEREFSVFYEDKDSSDPNMPWSTMTRQTTKEDIVNGDKVPHFIIQFLRPLGVFDKNYLKPGILTNRSTLLREPQQQALERMKNVMLSEKSDTRFMVIMPTGTGKSRVIALAPFVLSSRKVLIIAPGLELKEQLLLDTSTFYEDQQKRSDKILTFFQGQQLPKCSTFEKARASVDDLAVANIQQLMARAKAQREDVPDEMNGHDGIANGEQGQILHERAREFLKDFKADLVIVDEGHHSEADSWRKLENALLNFNSKCKVLLLTATPLRGDGETFKLCKDPPHYFLYSRGEAQRNKYIKSTVFKPVTIAGDKREMVSPEDFRTMLDPAVKQLLDLRAQMGNKPIRLLMTVRTNKMAADVAKFFNETYSASCGVHAAAITGKVNQLELDRIKKLFKCDKVENERDIMVDVGVQCTMLGEGYDNPWIAITVFISPPNAVGKLSQVHGRAIRAYDAAKVPRSNSYALHDTSYLFYPDWIEVKKVIEAYQNGEDETEEFLFDAPVFPDLKTANTKIAKKSTSEAVEILQKNYNDYHDLYSERREGWEFIPAECVADYIWNNFAHSDILRIVDFGCGRDGLFEHRLARNWKGPGKVYVEAVDVKLLENVPEPTDIFHCQPVASNYDLLHEEGVESTRSFDIAIFCLSIMAKDGLSVGLRAALRAVKPVNGLIFIIVSETKFAYHKKDRMMENLARFKESLAELNLKPEEAPATLPQIKDGMVYLLLRAPGEESLSKTMDGLVNLEFVKKPVAAEEDGGNKRTRTDNSNGEEEEEI